MKNRNHRSKNWHKSLAYIFLFCFILLIFIYFRVNNMNQMLINDSDRYYDEEETQNVHVLKTKNPHINAVRLMLF